MEITGCRLRGSRRKPDCACGLLPSAESTREGIASARLSGYKNGARRKSIAARQRPTVLETARTRTAVDPGGSDAGCGRYSGLRILDRKVSSGRVPVSEVFRFPRRQEHDDAGCSAPPKVREN